MIRRLALLGLLVSLASGCAEAPDTEAPGAPGRAAHRPLSGKALATELARSVPAAPEARTAQQHADLLARLTAEARIHLARNDRAVVPRDGQELAAFLPDLGGWVRGSDTHLGTHDFQGHRYTIAHRRYRTPAGLLDLDIIDAGTSPDILAPFAARRALAMHDPDGPVRPTPGGGGRCLQWLEPETGQQWLELLLGNRILIRVSGPERMPGRRLVQAAARIDHRALRALLRRVPPV